MKEGLWNYAPGLVVLSSGIQHRDRTLLTNKLIAMLCYFTDPQVNVIWMDPSSMTSLEKEEEDQDVQKILKIEVL